MLDDHEVCFRAGIKGTLPVEFAVMTIDDFAVRDGRCLSPWGKKLT